MTIPVAADRCAYVARRLDEVATATASQVRRWLLVEQPGPWGERALFESRLGLDVAGELARRAKAARTRVVLIRRGVGSGGSLDGPSGGSPDGPSGKTSAGSSGSTSAGVDQPTRRWYVARSDVGATGITTGSFGEDRELLDVDLRAALDGVRSDHHPIFLVCTNGRHDPCCAEFGRPVFRRLTEARPDEAVFECAHIGGDRFAANIVCLPEGVYYGRVPEDGAADLVSRYRQRQLDLDLYRGRSCHSWPEQAAEGAVRRHLDAVGIDDVTVTGSTSLADRRWQVRLAVAHHGRWVVEVERSLDPEPRTLTCKGDTVRPPVMAVTAMTQEAVGAG